MVPFFFLFVCLFVCFLFFLFFFFFLFLLEFGQGLFFYNHLNIPHLPSGLVYPYQLDESISNLRGVWCTFFMYILFLIEMHVS